MHFCSFLPEHSSRPLFRTDCGARYDTKVEALGTSQDIWGYLDASHPDASLMKMSRSPNRLPQRVRRAPCAKKIVKSVLLRVNGVMAMCLVGCASPGPPQPPSLHLPSLAAELRAERVGGHVTLSWTTPADTTDGDALREPVTAVLWRQAVAGGLSLSPACHAVESRSLPPGPSELRDELPAPLASGSPALLAYQVELRNGRGRSAGLSAPVFAAAGSSPAPVAELELTPRREGALITWQPHPSQAFVELRRTTLVSTSPAGGEAARPGKKASPALFAGKPATKGDAPGVLLLRAGSGAVPLGRSRGTDVGGMLDRSVRDLESYTYRAQRVQTVSLQGQQVELRSEPSAAVNFAFRNTFPPHAPTAPRSVPVGGFGAPISIDLSWEPGQEADVAGYNVYRQTDAGPFLRLNPTPIAEPALHDAAVQPGHTYTYRVTAIDGRKNESAPSSETREALRN